MSYKHKDQYAPKNETPPCYGNAMEKVATNEMERTVPNGRG